MRVKGKFIAAKLVLIGCLLWIYVVFKFPMSQFSPTSKYRSNNHESSSSAASAHAQNIRSQVRRSPRDQFPKHRLRTSPLKIPHVDPFSSKPLPTPMPSTAVDYTDPFDVKSRLFYGNVYFQSSKYQAHGEQIFRSKSLQVKIFKYRFTATFPTSHSVPPVT